MDHGMLKKNTRVNLQLALILTMNALVENLLNKNA